MNNTLVPVELLLSDEIGPLGKTVWMMARTKRDWSLLSLSNELGTSRSTVRRHCHCLQENGWMKTNNGRLAACIPTDVQKIRARGISDLVYMAANVGETLMKLWLDLLITSQDYVDNARPDFLRNPATKIPMEYDRYYLDKVAFEYNGPQHYGPTNKYSDVERFESLRGRDLTKVGLSQENGVELVIVTSEDLGFDQMRAKIPDVLVVRLIESGEPLVKALEVECGRYIERIKNIRNSSKSK